MAHRSSRCAPAAQSCCAAAASKAPRPSPIGGTFVGVYGLGTRHRMVGGRVFPPTNTRGGPRRRPTITVQFGRITPPMLNTVGPEARSDDQRKLFTECADSGHVSTSS